MGTKTDAKAKREDVAPSRWLELATQFPLRPIRSDDEAARAVAVVDRLTDIGALTPDEEDYLLVLSGLIADYEDGHEPDDATPADVLRHLMEVKGVSQTDVARGTALSDATISHILGGNRPPSRRAIAALSAYIKVEPAVFL